MRHLLFIQGAGAGVHAEWDIRLVESLRRELGTSWSVHYPPMPDEANPAAAAWRPAIARELAALPTGAVVVGHSAGGTMLVDVLAHAKPARGLAAVVLIAAPFIGDGGWAIDDIAPMTGLGERLPPATPVLLFHGTDDGDVPVAHVDCYAAAVPHATVCRLSGRDHQLNDDLSEVARAILALPSERGI
ncbi:MAG: alpha/beta fold hydrolase [Vicinamibacterales bacterium]